LKTIGLLGGMSWESSAEYYRFINEAARDRLGGLHSAESVMFSFDFAEIEALQRAGSWEEAAERLAEAARGLERAGAEILVLCTNTMHRLADELERAIEIPLLHIADPTADRIRAEGLAVVGLLGTRYTMEGDFYRGRLEDRHGLRILTPGTDDRATVHRVIYEELVAGEVRDESRDRYREIIGRLAADGAEAVILGCTEIELLVGAEDSPVPVFDTTRIHAEAAVDLALA